MKKLVAWWKSLDPSMRALILIGFICLIGIIIRWPQVLNGLKKGFNYYSGYAD
ncbi:MAG: hypothetical protein J6Z32_01395 [Bacteroidales bacterium]|nr:hypothetical protein [Bacteroidales bacterium]